MDIRRQKCIRGASGAGQKTLQASLIDFRFFLPIPAGWDHLTRSLPLFLASALMLDCGSYFPSSRAAPVRC